MSRTLSVSRTFSLLLLITTVFIGFASASGPYKIGSANTVTADPNVGHPSTTPCSVPLFSGAAFFDFNVENYSYAPPADCPGPWAKVVLVSDIYVNAGIQYDRTANFWLGPVSIYFGTTAEPSSNVGPKWHVESNLTDYSSIFYTAQSGQAEIGNTLCCGLTSTIYASASLLFYPLAPQEQPPVTADQVIALSAGPAGGTVSLDTTSSTLAGTFSFPLNVKTAYLDVWAQSQSSDEFWYTCVPNDVATELESCSNTAFRETEITIDGQPAGVAPVFPWIFTGGIDPYLWFPIPGVQTLNLAPYRVNLTPFAGLLSNGQQHTVSLSVYNANNYFSATASLLLYLDPTTPQITGAVTTNTLAPPSPVVVENINVQPTFTEGTVRVNSNRSFLISGYVETSQGKIQTTVSQRINFSSNQFFNINANEFVQDISQASNLSAQTTTSGGGASTVTNQTFGFPLTLDIAQVVQANGDINQTTTAGQNYLASLSKAQNGEVGYANSLENKAQHTDTLEFDSSFNLLGNTGQSAGQQYTYQDSTGASYVCYLTAAANVLTNFSSGCPR